jgi:hypothetical protein
MSLKSGSTGMPATPTTHWTIGKVHQQAIDTCNTSGVMGGRAPITGGVITINSRINQGASCAALLPSLSSVNKAVLIVKLTNTVTTVEIDPTTGLPVIDPVTMQPVMTTQTRTVAVVRAKDPVVTQSGNGFHITGTVQQSAAGNKPFGGDVFEAQVNVDNSADVAACNSMTSVPLTQVNFSTAGGSSISIHP